MHPRHRGEEAFRGEDPKPNSSVAQSKVPRSWHVVDALPMTPSAKIRRGELRERAAKARDGATS